MKPEPIFDARCRAGEGIIFDRKRARLYWVDILAGLVFEADPASGVTRTWNVGQPVGCMALCVDADRLLVGLRDGFAFLDKMTGQVSPVVDPEPDRPDNRLNDGACDPVGHFWAGTMRMGGPRPGDEPVGALYRLDAGLRCTRILKGFHIVNGLAFSPDGKTMYVSETVGNPKIWAFDYDVEGGTPSNRRVFVDAETMGLHPDGATVDEEGGYWIADAGGWRILRFSPDGWVDKEIAMPVEKPSKVAIADGTLFITSLDIGLSAGTTQPQAGRVFACPVALKGISAPLFAG